MIRFPSFILVRSLAAASAIAAPLLLAAAPAPATVIAGTFALATAGRAVTVPDGSQGYGYTLAPTPNNSVSAPMPLDFNNKAPEFSPGLFRPKKAYGGEGFIAGSTVQDQQQRKVGPTPGINLKVPLD